uniref:DUF4408 domain-containing protein n=1 Tax=Leersia perrieri TaxID=77586 RepID=A0A0D9X7N6_9ORYZ
MALEILSWLSPGAASWFVFLNVIVGAIAVMSWLGQSGGHAAVTTPSSARRKLARTASTVVMERLRSVANFPFQYLTADYSVTPLHGDVSGSDYFYYPPQQAEEVVAQTSNAMVLETVPLKPEPPAPAVKEIATATVMAISSSPSPVAVSPAAVTIKKVEEEGAETEEESISLDEAYALAQQAQGRTTRSAADPAPAKAAARMAQRGRAEEVEEVGASKAEVNARAERFIKQFREDLKLQRINSIINYTNALRRRGGGAS